MDLTIRQLIYNVLTTYGGCTEDTAQIIISIGPDGVPSLMSALNWEGQSPRFYVRYDDAAALKKLLKLE